MPPRPSDSWAVRDLNPGSSFHEQVQSVLSGTNFQQLQHLALLARVGQNKTADPSISCAIDPSAFTFGFNNVVLEVSFSDDVYWIARILYTPVDVSQGYRNAGDLLSEVATMEAVKNQTSIPVPQIFAFDASSTNEVGYPDMLMEHLQGHILEGTIASQVPPAFLPKVARQLADILFQLDALSFDRLGRFWCGTTGTNPPEVVSLDSDDATSRCPDPRTSLEWFYTQRQEENRQALEQHPDDLECGVLGSEDGSAAHRHRGSGAWPLSSVPPRLAPR